MGSADRLSRSSRELLRARLSRSCESTANWGSFSEAQVPGSWCCTPDKRTSWALGPFPFGGLARRVRPPLFTAPL